MLRAISAVRTTLELRDPLFVRLNARAALEGTTLKQLLRVFVEKVFGLHEQAGQPPRGRAEGLPQVHRELPLIPDQLSNARLFELLDA